MQSLEKYMLPCLNKKLFGVECMGCGIQRSISLIFQGDFVAAFKMYPAIYPLIFLFIYIGSNMVFKFKNSNIITTILAIATIVTIVTSYFIKIIN
ncbi:Protein of unknown function [Algibacter lectus]|uniref:DUF2752 domain-containing protein n=1 Tax=Algibacter lectus TaxID=221126 RepID=UPI0008E95CF7|nr:DUF2752 domain-containing protein [Algibacter lectus]SFC47647.1 Protein of unknown function [Algibacter lectus]